MSSFLDEEPGVYVCVHANLSGVPACVLAAYSKGDVQLSNEQRDLIYFWLIVLVVTSIVLGVAGYLFHRRLRKAVVATQEEEGFSLSQMRRLYEAGEISHAEYTRLREKLLAASHAAMLGETRPTPLNTPPAPKAPAEDPPSAGPDSAPEDESPDAER